MTSALRSPLEASASLLSTSKREHSYILKSAPKTHTIFHCEDGSALRSQASLDLQFLTSSIPRPQDCELYLKVIGDPKPLARHRMAPNRRVYNPSSIDQTNFAAACRPFLPSPPWEQPLVAVFAFYLPRPLNHYKSGKLSHQLKNLAPQLHSGRKDLDNLIKFVLDALNGKAYVDDGQIVAIQAFKHYADHSSPPRTEVGFSVVRDVLWASAKEVKDSGV